MSGQRQHEHIDLGGTDSASNLDPRSCTPDFPEALDHASALVNSLSASREVEEHRRNIKGVLTVHFQQRSVSLHSNAAIALRTLASVQATSKDWSVIGDPTSIGLDEGWTLVRVGPIEGITWSAHSDGSAYAN